MKRKKFTDQEKQELLKNANILKIGVCGITYNPAFKIQAIDKYQQGKLPIQIFNEAGFDLQIIGKEQPRSCLKRWRKTSKEKGKEGLISETRGSSRGGCRPMTKPLSIEDEIKQLESRNAYLEAENDFLKKLKGLLKKAERTGGKVEITVRKKFQIISSAIEKSKDLSITYLCKTADVSRSGYYYQLKTKDNKILKDKR
jgi:transposase-like protein